MGAQGPLDKNISFAHFNVRGLIGNYYLLQQFISTYKPDVVALQETMLGPNSKLKNKLNIQYKNYKMYRKDTSPANGV